MRTRELHSDYYRDRWSESDLCNDFPGDKILIDGLHAMQHHFYTNGVYVDIPIVRVMNTAHFLAAYMFATTCSGDQTEYDALAAMSLGSDKQMFRLAMIVLAAILARTEGLRARQCRSLVLDKRDTDFEEGVSLYNRFLQSAEKRFAEEDFLIDAHSQIQKLVAENAQLREEKDQLEIQYRLMKNQQNIQYKQDNNQGTIYNAPVYITYMSHQPSEVGSQPSRPRAGSQPSDGSDLHHGHGLSILFTRKAKQEHKESAIIEALEQSVQGRRDKTRALVTELSQWQKEGYIDAHYNARVMYDELYKLIPLPFGYEVFKKHYNHTI
ncbi:MAG: hypothetical protein IJ814_06275 [Paludibacteraceae bacterium]|nr:hypothetical protein [Paludibacteraceae bacterium]